LGKIQTSQGVEALWTDGSATGPGFSSTVGEDRKSIEKAPGLGKKNKTGAENGGKT